MDAQRVKGWGIDEQAFSKWNKGRQAGKTNIFGGFYNYRGVLEHYFEANLVWEAFDFCQLQKGLWNARHCIGGQG
jgi:hypothetical protein